MSLSDIASRTGLSRAAISNYAKGERANHFPAPVARVTSTTSLYEWAAVATWLFQRKHLARDKAIEAEAVRLANVAIRSRDATLDKAQGQLEAFERGLTAAH